MRMKPLPWSYSSLDTFKNCPRQYHAKYVTKSVKDEQSEAIIWGNKVHKHFEERLAYNTPLPKELQDHEPFMKQLEDMPGILTTEQKIALDVSMKPCNFFQQDVWFRGVIDCCIVDKDAATIVDHKTGKQHQKFEQLMLFALHTFALYPTVERVEACFYWTQTKETTARVFWRKERKQLWGKFVPDLTQYAEAFESDIWQPRQSGLCRAWCPVLDCEHNGKNPNR